MNQLPPPTRLSRMAPPSNSIMVTIRARPHLQPVPVRRSYDIYIPPSYAFEPYPKPASFDPALTTRIDVLHPDPVDRRTVALETEDQHAFNLRCKMEKERTLRDRYHNAYSRYYYGDAVNKEIYRKYLRESLKQQISEKESNKFRQISEKQRAERILLVKCFYKNNECFEAAIRAFGTSMNIKERGNLPDRHTVLSLITKFEKEGTVHILPKSGRPIDESVRAVKTPKL